MVTTLFSDEIVNATELRKKQSHWLTKATKRPITITYGANQLTILDRDKIRSLYHREYYLEQAIKYCKEVMTGTKSSTFPWVMYLNNKEKAQFHRELIMSVADAVLSDNWPDVEIVIDDWKATAETIQDTKAMKALSKCIRVKDYIPLKA